MHDLSALESNESYEHMEWEEEAEDELDESQELESAAELLSVGSEGELDHFLGDLIKKAAGKIGRRVKGAAGSKLGGLLKGIARKALPMVATAIGGPVGGLAAQGGLNAAMKAFGLELEGLSEEDQELELARRFVRLANSATQRTLRQGAGRDPRSAVRWAMRRHAPGMFRRRRRPGGAVSSFGFPGHGFEPCPPCAPCPTCPECGAPTPPAGTEAAPADSGAKEFEGEFEDEFEDEDERSYEFEAKAGLAGGSGGRWVRRGNRIVLFGA